jgi:hypothetical protein
MMEIWENVERSWEGPRWIAVSRAHQPNIDLSVAQNAPINDVQPFPCRLGASPSRFNSLSPLLHTSST